MEETITQPQTIKVGINKLLFEKRMELGWSRKEAAKKLGMSQLRLTLIERGYIKVSVARHFAFKDVYQLPEEFFYDHYNYPITINEKLYEPIKINEKLEKIAKKKSIRIPGFILSTISLAILITGLCLMPNINKSTTSYYTQEILDVRTSLQQNGKKGRLVDDSEVRMVPIADEYYFENIEDAYEGKYKNLVINCYVRDAFLPMLFYQGETVQTVNDIEYKFQLESRYMGDNVKRVHIRLSEDFIIGHLPCANITANIINVPGSKEYTYTYSTITSLNHGKGNTDLHPGDELYEQYTSAFESIYPSFDNDLNILFRDTYLSSITTYKDFNSMMANSSTKYYSITTTSRVMCGVGLILTIIFGGIVFFAYYLAGTRKRKYAKFEVDQEDDRAKPYVTLSREEGKKELPKNTWFDLYVPEFFVRGLSLVLLFASSMAIFFLVMSVLKLNVSSIIYTYENYAKYSSLSVIAVMLLYFVKLDIYQNKKSAVGYSIFLFALGLLYYFGLLFIYYALCQYSVKAEIVTLLLFDFLPGNIVWGVLVFNLIILYMFKPVKKKYQGNKKMEVLLRLRTLIPFSYLIASTVIFFGIKAGGWDMPYAVSSLFFYKAPMITVFALAYCVAVFIYRKYTIKKYGNVNGIIYQNGNKYNLLRNIMAASIVLAIGIFDLLCMFFWKDNAFGFGSNWLMLFAVPFILFYHPHVGKRNSNWDLVFNTLYGIVYIIGYVLIAFALLKVFITM